MKPKNKTPVQPLLVVGASLLVLAVLACRPAQEPAQAPAALVENDIRVRMPEQAPLSFAMPDGSKRTVLSLLNIKRRMHFGDFEWNDMDVPEGPVWVRVDLAAQTISIFRAGHEIGSAVILYGTDGHPTPTGLFTVREKDKNHWSRSYDAPMPFMLGLTEDGVAIHASDVVRGYATHGCIGVPRAFARRLFSVMQKGDPVLIEPGRA